MLGLIIVFVVAIGIAAGASWFVHQLTLPSVLIVSLDVLIWVTLGGALAGPWSNRPFRADREIVEKLRSRRGRLPEHPNDP